MDWGFLIPAALVGFALAAYSYDRSQKAEAERRAKAGQLLAENRARWRQLELGMSESDAVALVGPPVHVEASVDAKLWQYTGGGEIRVLDGIVIAWKEPSA